MNKAKTDNSYLDIKVNLRVDNLPDKPSLNVLDAFAGKGLIWSRVSELTRSKLNVLAVDLIYRNNIDIACDNLKVLSGIDLSVFDVIDLDAYGCPFAQMQILFNHNYTGRVFVTFIQTFFGRLPDGILMQAGYSIAMIKKARTLFSSNPLTVLEQYLAANGVNHYTKISLDRKHYLFYDVPIKNKENQNE